MFQFILIQHPAVTGICQVTGVTQPVTGVFVPVHPDPTPCCNWNMSSNRCSTACDRCFSSSSSSSSNTLLSVTARNTQNGSNRCNTLYTACDWSFLATILNKKTLIQVKIVFACNFMYVSIFDSNQFLFSHFFFFFFFWWWFVSSAYPVMPQRRNFCDVIRTIRAGL